MNSFASLSYDQQVARLTGAAQAALGSYSLRGSTVRFVLYVHNAMFQVTAPSGESYALRLQFPRLHKTFEQIRSELRWLSALRRDTTLQVPEPVVSDEGYITFQPIEGLAEPVSVVLFRWLDGEHLTETLTTAQAVEAGRFLARLHTQSKQYVLPPEFDRPRFDWDGLLGERSLYFPGDNRSIFTPEQSGIFACAAASLVDQMTALGNRPGSFGLIHADFVLSNMLFNEKGVGALDFDDCGFGFYLYDLAPLLLQLLDQPDYVDLRQAFLDGYASLLPLVDGDAAVIESMIAARLLRSCYWIASNLHNPKIRAQAPAILEYRAATLRDYLDTGRVSRRGEQF
jgi:Ser/Thr protein kinase RdoA (MazF antagonist)